MIKKIYQNKIYISASIIISSFLFILLGWYARSYYSIHVQDREGEILQVREDSPEYLFINPLLYVSDRRSVDFHNYVDLKKQVDNYIKKVPGETALNTSFYFKDLKNSDWIGVNDNELYAPGSMLKVSVLMAYLKLADNDPKVMFETAYYKPMTDSGQFYRPRSLLVPGLYPVKDLLQQMIVESDNDAMHALTVLHSEDIVKIYKDLKLPDPLQENLDFMSPREYSRLYRTLYNGAYISHFYSEQALKLLSLTTFDKGIIAGVSSTTLVANKFGEMTLETDNVVEERQLHDCGIVYYPGHPYFICIMTKGYDFLKLEKVISDISKITFDYIREHDEN